MDLKIDTNDRVRAETAESPLRAPSASAPSAAASSHSALAARDRIESPGPPLKAVYLAGPDVFYPDAAALFAQRREICTELGLKALIPLDSEATSSRDIFAANVALIANCDGVLINHTPFRGPHVDDGTAFEQGLIWASGKPAVAYSNTQRPLAERISESPHPPERDAAGLLIENFGLHANLMLVHSLANETAFPTFREAAQHLARLLAE